MPANITTRRPSKYGRLPSIKREVAEHLKEVMIEAVKPRFKKMIEAQMDAAIGITTEQHDRRTGALYYTDEVPSAQSAKLIMEYVLDKPKQEVKHTGSMGIVHLVAQLEDGDTTEEN